MSHGSDKTPTPDPDATIQSNVGDDDSASIGLRHGDSVGPFKILSSIGEGGFGVVYLADQTAPVKRRVALKIIKPGMDTKAVIARFEAERQALAMMDHPGIARVYEAGATTEGRPYFVMEYVKGDPIDVYCDKHRLDTKARLDLFAKVCDAIQHAHQKGVIHRDLKPGNILVMINDRDEPQPKVIDFGIAKATAQQLTEMTIFTQHGQLIGTPEYMSPEQAEMSAVDIDTRSDVYSLGVILYELLSGKLPFEPKTLRSKGLASIQQIIREEDPPKPSTKLITLSGDEGERIAEARRTKPSELKSTLRSELEWIPLKALRKERTDRYGSAEAFGDDVRRYLKGQPLEAGPESASYRFRKLIRRNKGPFIAAALIALALIAGIIGTTLFAVQASRQAQLAQARADDLNIVAEFQAQQLSDIDVTAMGASLRQRMLQELELEPTQATNADFTGAALGLLNQHVFDQTYTTINEQFADQPLVRAQLLQSLAQTLRSLGLLNESAASQEEALQLRREHLGREHPDTLTSTNEMGNLLFLQGQYDQAMPYFKEDLETSRRVRGDDHPETLVALTAMGNLLASQRQYEQAQVHLEEALERRRRVLGHDHPKTIRAINNMGKLLSRQGKYDEAMPYYAQSLEASRRVLGDEHPDTLVTICSMGHLLYKQGSYELALPYYTEDLTTSRRVLGDEHPSTLTSMSHMGSLLAAQGKQEEALALFQKTLETRRRVLGNDHPETLGSIRSVGTELYLLERYGEAEPYFRELLEARQRQLGPDDVQTLTGQLNMSKVLYRQGKLKEAEPYLRQALDGRRRVLGNEDPGTLNTIFNMGKLLNDQGRFDEALVYYMEFYDAKQRAEDTDLSDLILITELLIELHDAWHEAEPDAGHDAMAAQYRAQLEDLKQE